ncbi:MAG: flagellar basal body-associated FliL family protein [Bdellovibrionales bacterium]|nr:flagellar basal body-associated FliL family protein [Bdellovibrionales bacterium]
MAEEKEASVTEAPPKGSKLPMLLVLANSVAVVATLGALVYTRVLFKRPEITESSERKRLADSSAKPTASLLPGKVEFKAVTVNILPTPEKPEGGAGSPGEGKPHFVTLAFSVEIRDLSLAAGIDAVRPEIEDRLLQLLGRKPFDELNSIQGRYHLRAEILDIVNELTGKPLATDVFFTQFIVQ